jgi:hypothetical protein
MATTFSKTRQPSNSTDAHFRAWIEFIDNTLTGGGWVNTADSGQTAVASFVAPTTTNQARGYRMYRMDDPLQATAPVFLRIDFGSGNTTNTMAVWITLGPETDGAGAVVSPWVSAPTTAAANVQASSNSTSLSLPYSFGSAGTDRVAIAFAVEMQVFGSGPYIFFSIERTYGTDGQPSADGVLFLYAHSGGVNISRYQYLQHPAGYQPPFDASMFRVESAEAPSAYSDLVGVSVLFPWFNGLPRQPGMNVLLAKRNDWARDARMVVEFYGAQRTYQALGSATIANGGNTLALMRYE